MRRQFVMERPKKNVKRTTSLFYRLLTANKSTLVTSHANTESGFSGQVCSKSFLNSFIIWHKEAKKLILSITRFCKVQGYNIYGKNVNTVIQSKKPLVV